MFETLQLIFYVVAILSGLLGIYAFVLNKITNNLNVSRQGSKSSTKKKPGPYKKKRS